MLRNRFYTLNATRRAAFASARAAGLGLPLAMPPLLLAAGLLVSCQSKSPSDFDSSGFDSTRPREWTGALTPADRGICPIQFESTRLKAFLEARQGNFEGYRIETPHTPVECTLRRTFEGQTQTRKITGYTRLLIYSKIELTGDLDLVRDLLGPGNPKAETLWLGARTVTPPTELKRRLLQELAFAPAVATVQDSFYEMYSQMGLIDFATLAASNSEATSKVDVDVSSHRWPQGSNPPGAHSNPNAGRTTEALSLRLPQGFPQHLREYLADLKTGDVSIALYTTRMKAPNPHHFFQWNLYLPIAATSSASDSLTHLPIVHILARLWQGATYSANRDLEQAALMADAVSWLTKPQVPPRTLREQLVPMLQYAQQIWNSTPSQAEIQLKARLYISSLKLLQLAKADETNPRVIQLVRLAPFYDSAYLDPADYVREIIALVADPYPGNQQTSVEELALELKAAHFPGVQAWKKARVLADELKLNAAEITRFAGIFHWMSQSIRAGFDADQALEMAHSFYFDRRITPGSFELVQGAFEWLTSLTGPHLYGPTAFSKTQTYVFERALTFEELSALKATYLWLRSDPDSSAAGPGLFTSAALSRAELYVLERSHTLETLDLFKRVYPWLISTEGPGLSVSGGLTKAEFLISTRSMTTPQFALMRELFSWLKSSQQNGRPAPGLYPSFALAKCEEYLFQRLLSEAQFTLLRDALNWLTDRSGPGLSASNGFIRAEKYLFLKQMTAERLGALKRAYAVPGTTLERAEIQAFGSRAN